MGEANRRRYWRDAQGIAHPSEMKATPSGLDDTDWFKANPRRAYRVRPAMSGEFPDTDMGDLTVIVRQDEDGLRSKRVIRSGPDVEITDDEDDARFLFGVISAAEEGRDPNEVIAEQMFSAK